jgi:hypothetical protein
MDKGETFHHGVFVPDFEDSLDAVKIPKPVVTLLAEFVVYNLTTRPTPKEEGKSRSQSPLTCISLCGKWHHSGLVAFDGSEHNSLG